jgi:hypothetical protein
LNATGEPPVTTEKIAMPLGNFNATAAVLLAVLSALVSAAGCGPAGPRRHEVSGQVTFQGQPVPVGVIRFLPDTKQGNAGPAGFAAIENGRYDTAATGRGTVGGPHEVVISGYDGKADPAVELMQGAPLFPDYRKGVDLPEEPATLDFQVTSGSGQPE